MPKLKKLKITVILAVAFGLNIIYPTYALAPKAEKIQILQKMAVTQPKSYAKVRMVKYGWGNKQNQCLRALWGKESAWNYLADNPDSSAFGIAQMLGEKSINPRIQINNGLRYIKHRYGQPCNAWRFWQRNNWY